MDVKWYLAGPMTGIAQFNIPAFDEATDSLRSQGFTIVSPAERDTYETRKAALGSASGDHADLSIAETYGDMLARDMKIIADEVDGIVFLPGWHESRGARTEAYIALAFNRKFAVYKDGTMLVIPKQAVKTWLVHGINGS